MNMSKRRINLYFIAIAGELFWRESFFTCQKISSFCVHDFMYRFSVDEWARFINFKIATELFCWNLIISQHSWHFCDYAWLTYFSVEFSWLELHVHSNQKPGIKGLRNFLKYGFRRVSVIWFMGIFLWCNTQL